MEQGSSPEKFTTLDRPIDRQIGGLGAALENVIGTTRAVPLLEFRNLDGVHAGAMQPTVHNIEQAIIAVHNQYKSTPSRKKKTRGAPAASARTRETVQSHRLRPRHQHHTIRCRTKTRTKVSTAVATSVVPRSFRYLRSPQLRTTRKVAPTPPSPCPACPTRFPSRQ